ncbi:amino acid ABC transporter permease [Falsiroseomonas oryziterrae]|uniref:amino acid ABC transporter permease n=1 Tax=Falsiroseomonas oryziterrae TaxID=2911368 RepID=UPI001F2DD413|nr:amino acid ABC transporter permease [Roseomonas sp. NPKOSM-4]
MRPRPLPSGTDLPVLLPAADRLARRAAEERRLALPRVTLDARWGAAILVTVLLSAAAAQAQSAPGQESVLATIWKWTPLVGQGFLLNIAISVVAMTCGTLLGVLLGLAQISLLAPVRAGSWFLTQFFRNAPWLVLLFYCIFMLPYRVTIAGEVIEIPNWLRATLGLTLPVMANVSEIVRGAVQSLAKGQWEAAESLAFSRGQTLRMVILPQCLKRMLPPWMNLYAILIMSTPLASIVGVEEAMTLARGALNAERRGDLLIPVYGLLLLAFFVYCYPIARATRWLERRAQVRI